MRRVQFNEWSFDVDVERTRETFDSVKSGGSEYCLCDYCKNYRAQKQAVFPLEISDLFEQLGIDYKKECETWVTHKLGNGLFDYRGWFHFAGRILEGPDCKRELSENSYTLDLKTVNNGFRIGFTSGKDLTFFDKADALVQVEFEAHIPWVIAEPEPED